MKNARRDPDAGKWGKSFLRTFFLMSAMNTERMQNIGFAWSVCPLLAKTDKPSAKPFNGHVEFFNTNPYLAPTIVGAVGRMEADGRSAEEIRTFKREMMGPFGAIGDSLFWCALKPVAALFGVMLGLIAGPLAAALGTLAVYNPPQIGMRAWGFFGGVRYGKWIVGKFARIPFGKICGILGASASVILGAATATMTYFAFRHYSGDVGRGEFKALYALVAAFVVICVSMLNDKTHKSEAIFYAATVVASILLYMNR